MQKPHNIINNKLNSGLTDTADTIFTQNNIKLTKTTPTNQPANHQIKSPII